MNRNANTILMATVLSFATTGALAGISDSVIYADESSHTVELGVQSGDTPVNESLRTSLMVTNHSVLLNWARLR